MKWIVRIALLAVVLGVIGVLALFFFVNPLLKQGVEQGGTYAMGVDTRLENIDLGLFSGQLDLSGLQVANPEGFRAAHFFELGSVEVAVTLPSLLADTVQVPLIELKKIELHLEEENGKKNYAVILDNLKKLSSSEPEPGSQPEEEKKEEKPGKGFVIKTLTISDVTVHADWAGQTLRVNVPEIPLSDIGSESEGGVVLAELSGIIIEAILRAVVENAANLFPAGLLTDLDQGLAALGKLGNYTTGAVTEVTAAAAEALEGAASDVKKATEDVTKSVDDAAAQLDAAAAKGTKELDAAAAKGTKELDKVTEQVDKGVKDLGEGFKGLLQGKKDSK